MQYAPTRNFCYVGYDAGYFVCARNELKGKVSGELDVFAAEFGVGADVVPGCAF